jgi:hypothetical protein
LCAKRHPEGSFVVPALSEVADAFRQMTAGGYGS